MARSSKKGVWTHPGLVKKIQARNQLDETKRYAEPITTYCRSSTILTSFLNHTFKIHKGQHNKLEVVKIKEKHIGHKLGEFAIPKKSANHSSTLRSKFKSKK